MLRGETEPLSNGNIVVDSGLEHLKIHAVNRTGILNVVGVRKGNVPDITGLEVECTRCLWSIENSQTSLARQEE